jgi:enterochelin esterase-like enzyme
MKKSFLTLFFSLSLMTLSSCGAINTESGFSLADYPLIQEQFRSPFLDITYESAVTNSTKNATVILPFDYKENENYPVLYFLHGVGSDHKGMIKDGHMEIISGKMMENGSRKFITVLVNLNMNETEEILNLENKYMMDKATEDIMQSLMPYINDNFNVLKDRDNTYICGISYGGRVALDTAIKYKDTFSKVGAFEPWKLQTGTIEKNKDRAKSLYIYIQQGTNDRLVFDEPTKISRTMDSYGIKNTLSQTSYGHCYDAWREGYQEFLEAIL